jgi:hypothetical protein
MKLCNRDLGSSGLSGPRQIRIDPERTLYEHSARDLVQAHAVERSVESSAVGAAACGSAFGVAPRAAHLRKSAAAPYLSELHNFL